MVRIIDGHSGTSCADETSALGKNTFSFLIDASRHSPLVTIVVCVTGAGAFPTSYIVNHHFTKSRATLLATRTVLNLTSSPVFIQLRTRTLDHSAKKSVFMTVSSTNDCITS
jgi:hypothetical protein